MTIPSLADQIRANPIPACDVIRAAERYLRLTDAARHEDATWTEQDRWALVGARAELRQALRRLWE